MKLGRKGQTNPFRTRSSQATSINLHIRCRSVENPKRVPRVFKTRFIIWVNRRYSTTAVNSRPPAKASFPLLSSYKLRQPQLWREKGCLETLKPILKSPKKFYGLFGNNPFLERNAIKQIWRSCCKFYKNQREFFPYFFLKNPWLPATKPPFKS